VVADESNGGLGYSSPSCPWVNLDRGAPVSWCKANGRRTVKEWRVLAEPEGNKFCVVAQRIPAQPEDFHD